MILNEQKRIKESKLPKKEKVCTRRHSKFIDINAKIFYGMTPKQYLFANRYLENGHNELEAKRVCGYTPGCHPFDSEIVQEYVKNKISKAIEMEGIGYDWKVKKLAQVAKVAIPDKLDDIDKKVTVGISAIAELNKMQGDYAAEKRINVNANTDIDPLIKSSKELFDKLIIENKKEY